MRDGGPLLRPELFRSVLPQRLQQAKPHLASRLRHLHQGALPQLLQAIEGILYFGTTDGHR